LKREDHCFRESATDGSIDFLVYGVKSDETACQILNIILPLYGLGIRNSILSYRRISF
jgi:hypothetical protein